jgi:hypothetical protein
MPGLLIGLGVLGIRISMRLGRRLVRPPSAARYQVHFVDLEHTPLNAIDARVPVKWEIARDLTSVQDLVRDLPVEHRSDIGDRLAHSHWCLV